ncbi:MAG TPA: hypothetical protein VIJ25_18770, partial [Methylococcales bacterium]
MNTQVLAPDASTQLRKLPAPESLVLVTSYTLPPLPPFEDVPKPSAPRKAGLDELTLVGVGVTTEVLAIVGVDVLVAVALGVLVFVSTGVLVVVGLR